MDLKQLTDHEALALIYSLEAAMHTTHKARDIAERILQLTKELP